MGVVVFVWGGDVFFSNTINVYLWLFKNFSIVNYHLIRIILLCIIFGIEDVSKNKCNSDVKIPYPISIFDTRWLLYLALLFCQSLVMYTEHLLKRLGHPEQKTNILTKIAFYLTWILLMPFYQYAIVCKSSLTSALTFTYCSTPLQLCTPTFIHN